MLRIRFLAVNEELDRVFPGAVFHIPKQPEPVKLITNTAGLA